MYERSPYTEGKFTKYNVLTIIFNAINVRVASFRAEIKPTAPLLAFDKENSVEFPLDLLHYIYNYYYGYTPCLLGSSCYLSADFFVTLL